VRSTTIGRIEISPQAIQAPTVEASFLIRKP
jgi:hypothetical protein